MSGANDFEGFSKDLKELNLFPKPTKAVSMKPAARSFYTHLIYTHLITVEPFLFRPTCVCSLGLFLWLGV